MMTKSVFIAAAFLLAVYPGEARAAVPVTIALAETCSEGIDAGSCEAFFDGLKDEIARTAGYRLVAPGETAEDRGGRRGFPWRSRDFYRQMAAASGADKIMTGMVRSYRGLYYVVFASIDGHSGKVSNIADDVCNADELVPLAKKVAARLLTHAFFFLEPNPKPGWNGVKEINEFFLAALEDPRRIDAQKPGLVIGRLPVKQGDTVADLGAGTGFYTTFLARKVGEKGTVYAVDIEKEMVEYLERRAKKEGLKNIKPVLAARDDPKLRKGSLDAAFLSYVYIAIPEKQRYFRTVKDLLRMHGRVVIVDYDIPPDLPLVQLRDLEYGPIHIDPESVESYLVIAGLLDINHIKNNLAGVGSSFYVRVPRQKVIEEVTKAGFTLDTQLDLVPGLYCLVFEKTQE